MMYKIPPLDTDRINIIVSSLSPADRLQLADLIEYSQQLADAKANPHGHVPEGSIQALFARQNPNVRAALDAIGAFASSPRFAPFEEKMSEGERFLQIGMRPNESVTLLAASDGLDVINGLQSRMGTDSAPSQQEQDSFYLANHAPTRASVENAVARHEPRRQLEQAVDEYTNNSSEGLSLRDTISTALDVKEHLHPQDPVENDRSDMGKWIEATIDQGDF